MTQYVSNNHLNILADIGFVTKNNIMIDKQQNIMLFYKSDYDFVKILDISYDSMEADDAFKHRVIQKLGKSKIYK